MKVQVPSDFSNKRVELSVLLQHAFSCKSSVSKKQQRIQPIPTQECLPRTQPYSHSMVGNRPTSLAKNVTPLLQAMAVCCPQHCNVHSFPYMHNLHATFATACIGRQSSYTFIKTLQCVSVHPPSGCCCVLHIIPYPQSRAPVFRDIFVCSNLSVIGDGQSHGVLAVNISKYVTMTSTIICYCDNRHYF